jgi:hypothetical protein
MPNSTINCAIKSENYNRTNYPFKVVLEPKHAQKTVYIKAKAISLVATIPSPAGDATIAAAQNESHTGIRS